MSTNDRAPAGAFHPCEESEELAALIDDAAKALSIGGATGSDGEIRRTMDCFKHQFARDPDGQ